MCLVLECEVQAMWMSYPTQSGKTKCGSHFNSLQSCRPSLILTFLKCFHHLGLANWQLRIDTVLICVFSVVQVEQGYERRPLKLVYWRASISGCIFFFSIHLRKISNWVLCMRSFTKFFNIFSGPLDSGEPKFLVLVLKWQ